MSRFATAVAAGGLSETFAYFGQSAICSPVNAPPVSLTAVVAPESRDVETSSGARTVGRRCTVQITNDPDSTYGGIADANEAMTVTISDVEWAVESVTAMVGGWILSLVLDELAEQARPGYRGGL